MCINTGKIDRIIRTIVGIGFIAYGIQAQNYIILSIGAIPLLTALIGFCPFYLLLKINTGCKR